MRGFNQNGDYYSIRSKFRLTVSKSTTHIPLRQLPSPLSLLWPLHGCEGPLSGLCISSQLSQEGSLLADSETEIGDDLGC